MPPRHQKIVSRLEEHEMKNAIEKIDAIIFWWRGGPEDRSGEATAMPIDGLNHLPEIAHLTPLERKQVYAVLRVLADRVEDVLFTKPEQEEFDILGLEDDDGEPAA